MAPKVEVKAGSMYYTGRTHKEAIGKALAHLEALFPDDSRETGVWAPVIVRAPDEKRGEAIAKGAPVGYNVGVVYKDSDGSWTYVINWSDGRTSGPILSAGQSRQLAEWRLRRHLAQVAYDPDTSGDTMHLLSADDREGRAEHQRWIAFQDDYRRLRAQGLSEKEAHAQALGGI